MIEIQPSSVSKYSTLGVPYSRKHFDFNAEKGDSLAENETYFTKISIARKNYIPNWRYTPFLYTRSGDWGSLNQGNLIYKKNKSFLPTLALLDTMEYY